MEQPAQKAIVPSCAGCICGIKVASPQEIGKEMYECHRFPPQLIVMFVPNGKGGMQNAPATAFPQVGKNAWCAEFRPRPGSTPPQPA